MLTTGVRPDRSVTLCLCKGVIVGWGGKKMRELFCVLFYILCAVYAVSLFMAECTVREKYHAINSISPSFTFRSFLGRFFKVQSLILFLKVFLRT